MWNWFPRSYCITSPTSPFQVSCHITGNDVALVRETAVWSYRRARISFHCKCIVYRFGPRCPHMTRLPSGWIKPMTDLITGKKWKPFSYHFLYAFYTTRKENETSHFTIISCHKIKKRDLLKMPEVSCVISCILLQAWIRIIYCGCGRVQEWRVKE